ncbi:unnamed protein product [Gongylonema pulchrum]|uniref:LAM_G_DOMAIN domain-containing protein n=1 Tax=Gongylonema pulchrum TaxID=637853 RepID=A0A183CUA2_9BILA|nr:unnamed protein product [Gongylonema pulchrum]
MAIYSGSYGFTGCVRQILIDGQLKAVESNLQSDCENKCDTHACQQESRCIEEFTLGTVICVCKNEILHSGDLCQNSINYGTEVSFHDAKRAFLKIQNPAIENAMMQRILFSFRTDRRDALLFYLHDQLYNFVQVHLSEHCRVILTLNFNRTVRRCEVVAKWIQVMIFQWPDRIELNVDDEICQITGHRILSPEFIKKFDISSDIDDVVEPPVSPLGVENSEQTRDYVLVFAGGVPTANYFGSLDPIYQSNVPNLLGCLRGLMLGTQLLDMRNRSFWSHYQTETDMIIAGCETGCHKIENLCKNGGHCAVQWTKSYIIDEASCNCARTSYYGEFCDQDSGAYFMGKTLLVFNAGEIFEKVIYDWSQIGEHTFNFAFSTTADWDISKSQVLATVHFEFNRIMEIVLCKNGSLNVGITSTDTSYVFTFPYNYNDGYRHFFQSTFRSRKPLKIAIDSWEHVFPNEIVTGLSLAFATKFIFGGPVMAYDFEQEPVSKKMTHHNYTGCLSNIEIDMNVARMHFKPILYLRKPTLEFAQSAFIVGDTPQFGACNAFLIPGSIPCDGAGHEHLPLIPDDKTSEIIKSTDPPYKIKDEYILPEPDHHLGKNQAFGAPLSAGVHPVTSYDGKNSGFVAGQQKSAPQDYRVRP